MAVMVITDSYGLCVVRRFLIDSNFQIKEGERTEPLPF